MSTEATLYVPTYKRGARQETWDWLPPRWRERTFLVTGPDEDESDTLDMLGFPVLHCPHAGIAAKRQFIFDQHDADRRGDTILMADDDFRFGVRRPEDPKRFYSPGRGGEGVGELFDELEHMMNFVAFGGVSPRQGANNAVEPYLLNTRINGVWGIRKSLAELHGIQIDRHSLLEDFSVGLQFLTRGVPTLRLNTHVYMDVGLSNANGGCSVYRDDLVQELAVLRLASDYPEFVVPVEKKGWQGMAETRMDVRIAWKKAYAAGRRWRHANGLPVLREPTWDERGELLPLG